MKARDLLLYLLREGRPIDPPPRGIRAADGGACPVSIWDRVGRRVVVAGPWRLPGDRRSWVAARCRCGRLDLVVAHTLAEGLADHCENCRERAKAEARRRPPLPVGHRQGLIEVLGPRGVYGEGRRRESGYATRCHGCGQDRWRSESNLRRGVESCARCSRSGSRA